MGDTFEIIADTREITHDEWLKLRRGGIGGSDAGPVMGMSPWSSPLSVWADKRGLLPPQDETDAMEYGKRMEPVLRQWFHDEVHKGLLLPVECAVEEYPFVLRSAEWPWAMANLDGIVLWNKERPDGFGVLELKTADRSQAKYWKQDEIPDGYFCQVQHYMAVTGSSFAYVFALVGKSPVLRHVPRNDAFIKKLMESERSMWEMVLSGEMPAPSGMDIDDDVLSLLYEGGGGEISLDAKSEQMARHVALGDEIKERKTERTEIGQQLKIAMGNAKRGTAPGYYCNWSRFKKHSVGVDRLRKEMPDIAQAFTREEAGERFTVNAASTKQEDKSNED